jgi:HD superfamily phosphohydrolase
MSGWPDIPEMVALDSRESLIRIPAEQDVPVTPRIRQLIDSQPFQRLKSVSQLGLVSLVYPGATHSRFEHSLGVYRMSLLFLERLATHAPFRAVITSSHVELMLVTALLHDIGHWPYCHPVEDMKLPNVPGHETLARQRLLESEIPEILEQHFHVSAQQVANLLEGRIEDQATAILHSLLSGPVDVDKMDYLYRDSLHAGVPYGMHYDRSRLIGSLCLDPSGRSLAITGKGCTAAELMVFARYVMFSEVYWHHAVRSATAMLQRAFFVLRDRLDLPGVFAAGDGEFRRMLLEAAGESVAGPLVQGLFGDRRFLYKRLAQFTFLADNHLFQRISRQPYDWLTRCAGHLITLVNRQAALDMQPADLLIDAPPPGLEVQFRINVCHPAGDHRPIDELSPVVRTLATEQFDNYVKRVRIFVHPRWQYLQQQPLDYVALLHEAINRTQADADGADADGA